MFELWTFSLSRIKRVKEYEDVDQKHQKSWGHDCWGVDGKCRRKPWRCWSVKWETHFHTSPVHVKDLNWKCICQIWSPCGLQGAAKILYNAIAALKESIYPSYNGGNIGWCLAYKGNTSDFDTNHYGHHCRLWDYFPTFT